MGRTDNGVNTKVYINEDLECIFVCAVRYTLGRRTYMPSIVTAYIKTQLEFMTDKCLKTMLRDIDGCTNLGDKCDCDTWHSFATAIEAELVKRTLIVEETEEKIEWCKPTLKDGVKEALTAMAKSEKSATEEVVKMEKALEETDSVNHPSHYTDGKIEVIEFIEDKKLGYHLGNVVKYVSRAGKKDASKTIEDLKKARWYLNRHILKLEDKSEANKTI